MSDQPTITEPVSAPEIFAEGFTHAEARAGVAKLPLFSVRRLPDGSEEARVVARLTLPLPAVIGVHEALGRFIQQLKDQGAIMEQPK